ncbi:carbohydrate ABC transporter permease [Tumebacillus permanentifrigoris]|uniref:Carbohydrate ABC transporter membrane protein 1 (CUT1 family) n=1 Tax=Tumebacillus permanentifrigoris TaxID=378543 RepID=A0A316DG15_9BACL|nr:sugar ABC transporter permease [Tumebacillus permanentifrigoris]PWK16558.1 carbohydrate ABC transporter membrane protein 1 (CUT1 family) [Tumebacillus permanentifrigoris]
MRPKRSTRFWRNRNSGSAYLFLTPALLILGLVILYPLLNTLWLSFQHKVLIRPDQDSFVGMENYIKALGDQEVRQATLHTIVFTVCSVGVKVVLGMLGALLLNVKMRGAAWVRSFYMLPWLVPSVVAALVWRWIFNDQFGIANGMLATFGGPAVNWLGQDTTAMFAVILVDIWRGLPLMTLLLLAGLQMIPRETIDATLIDGANAWQRYWRVILPLMKPTLIMVGTLSLIGTFNSFNIIYVMTGGGPAHATEILVTHVFRVAFQSFNFGYGSTLAVLILVLITILTSLYNRLLSGRGEAKL